MEFRGIVDALQDRGFAIVDIQYQVLSALIVCVYPLGFTGPGVEVAHQGLAALGIPEYERGATTDDLIAAVAKLFLGIFSTLVFGVGPVATRGLHDRECGR